MQNRSNAAESPHSAAITLSDSGADCGECHRHAASTTQIAIVENIVYVRDDADGKGIQLNAPTAVIS